MTDAFPSLRNLLAICLLATPSIMAAKNAFPPTEPGNFEVKTLPAGILLKSSTAEGSYFDNGGKLFRPLFRYISSHDISMTVPVEATIDDASMFFWVAKDQEDKVTNNQDGVEIVRIPPRRVAAHGFRGSYSAKNFAKAKADLMHWMQDQPDLKPVGEPYAVYWNGPFTLGFLKRFEVHVPLVPSA